MIIHCFVIETISISSVDFNTNLFIITEYMNFNLSIWLHTFLLFVYLLMFLHSYHNHTLVHYSLFRKICLLYTNDWEATWRGSHYFKKSARNSRNYKYFNIFYNIFVLHFIYIYIYIYFFFCKNVIKYQWNIMAYYVLLRFGMIYYIL